MKARLTPLECTAGTVVIATPPTLREAPKRTSCEALGSPPSAFSLPAKKRGISLPVTILAPLGEGDVHAVGVRHRDDRDVRLAAFAGVDRAHVAVADVIAVHVAHQHRVDARRDAGRPARPPCGPAS